MHRTHFIIAIVTLFTHTSTIIMANPAEDKAISVPFWEHESNKLSDLDDLALTFSKVEAINLKQSWLPAPETDFRPTDVKVTWKPESLYIFARIQDDSIYSSSTHFNQRLWELGDAFETFIQFKEANSYYEFHVSPNNHVMQLRFGVDLTPAQRQLQLPDLFIPKQLVESKVWLEEKKNEWYVLLKIPASVLKPSGIFVADDTFYFSFSRYDSDQTGKEPVLSSSSDHTELDFHRREDWGTLRLESRTHSPQVPLDQEDQ